MATQTSGGSGKGKAAGVLSDIAASAQEGFRRASADAAGAAERTVPLLKKGTYMVAYCLSFGVVYAGEVVAEMLPEDGVVMQGFRDGATAARDSRAAHDAEPGAAAPATS